MQVLYIPHTRTSDPELKDIPSRCTVHRVGHWSPASVLSPAYLVAVVTVLGDRRFGWLSNIELGGCRVSMGGRY